MGAFSQMAGQLIGTLTGGAGGSSGDSTAGSTSSTSTSTTNNITISTSADGSNSTGGGDILKGNSADTPILIMIVLAIVGVIMFTKKK